MGETKSRKVQIKQRQSLVDAFRLKAGTQGISMNQAANDAIEAYIKTGGENIISEKNRRMLLLVPERMYTELYELAKAQGVSVNKAIESAMEAYVTGEKTENIKNRLVTYISATGTLRNRVHEMSSAVNYGFGATRSIMERITNLREKKTSKAKEKERYEEILKEVDNLWATICAVTDEVNTIEQEPEVKLY